MQPISDLGLDQKGNPKGQSPTPNNNIGSDTAKSKLPFPKSHESPETNIVFIADDNYAMGLGVTLISLLANLNKEELLVSTKIFIIDLGLSEDSKRKLNEVNTRQCIYEIISCKQFQCLH